MRHETFSSTNRTNHQCSGRFLRTAIGAALVITLANAWVSRHRTALLADIHRNQAYQSDALPFLRERMARAPGTRIAFIGDSCIEGDRVADADTLPAAFERLLAQHQPGGHVTVFNFGVMGATATDRLNLVEYLLPARPQLIVMNLSVHLMWEARANFYVPGVRPNDSTRTPGPLRTLKGVVESQLVRLWPLYGLRGPVVTRWLGTTPDQLLLKPQNEPLQQPPWLASAYQWSPLEVEGSLARIGRAIHRCHRAGVPVFVFIGPVNQRYVTSRLGVPRQALHARGEYLARRMRGFGVRCASYADSVPDAQFFDWVHLHPEGNRRLAAALLRDLDGSLWQSVSRAAVPEARANATGDSADIDSW